MQGMDDVTALRVSQAGMRFIAQMTIYNSGDFERLRTFIAESYHPDLLLLESVDERVAAYREQRERMGKLRVQQVIGTAKHHVLVMLESQNLEDYFLNDLTVEEDYPHRIQEYSMVVLED
jgi:hypothetical protein